MQNADPSRGEREKKTTGWKMWIGNRMESKPNAANHTACPPHPTPTVKASSPSKNWPTSKRPPTSTRRSCSSGTRVRSASRWLTDRADARRFPEGLPLGHVDQGRIPENLQTVLPLWRSVVVCRLRVQRVRCRQVRYHRLQGVHLRAERHESGQDGGQARLGLPAVRHRRRRQDQLRRDAGHCGSHIQDGTSRLRPRGGAGVWGGC